MARPRYAPPPFMPGWSPMSPPTRPANRGEALQRAAVVAVPVILATAALFRGLPHLQHGLLAVVAAAAPFLLLLGLWYALLSSPSRLRTLIEWTAVAMVVILLSSAGVTAPNVDIVAEAQTRAPSKVEAQSRVEEFRQSIGDFIERVTAPVGQPEPKAKRKEHH